MAGGAPRPRLGSFPGVASKEVGQGRQKGLVPGGLVDNRDEPQLAMKTQPGCPRGGTVAHAAGSTV